MSRLTLAVLALLGSLLGCSANKATGDGPQLVTPGDPGAGGVTDHVRPVGKPVSFGSLPVCLDSPGRVVLDGVDLVGAPEGMTVTGFAVRPNPVTLGGRMILAERRPLASAGFDPSRHVVRTVCEKQAYELGVQVVRTVDRPVRAEALKVRWHNSTGGAGTLRIEFGIGLA